jgi:hypothetical protein
MTIDILTIVFVLVVVIIVVALAGDSLVDFFDKDK